MFVCLDEWPFFAVTCIVVPRNLRYLVIFTIYKYVFTFIYKTRTSYFKRIVSIVLIYTKIGVISLIALWIYFERTGKESVADYDPNVSVSKGGNKAIINLRFV